MLRINAKSSIANLAILMAICGCTQPIARQTVPSDYNISSVEEYAKAKEGPPRKVFVTSNPRALIAEDAVRQKLQESASITMTDLHTAEIVVEIQSYNIEIGGIENRVEPILLDKISVPNIMGAVLMMPEHSTYSIDIQHQSLTGAYEAAYILKGPEDKTGTPHVIRDSVELTGTVCSPPKVITAFGGVKPANFWASGQLEKLCTN